MPIDERDHAKPDAADTQRTGERAEADRAKGRSAPERTRDGKPDEGLHPDQLTSETDGGSQG